MLIITITVFSPPLSSCTCIDSRHVLNPKGRFGQADTDHIMQETDNDFSMWYFNGKHSLSPLNLGACKQQEMTLAIVMFCFTV